MHRGHTHEVLTVTNVPMATQHFDLALQRVSPLERPSLKTCFQMPFLSSKSLPPFHLCSETCRRTSSHTNSKRKESYVFLFTSHSLLKRIWSSRMEIVVGGGTREYYFSEMTWKQDAIFLPTKLKAKITQPKQEGRGTCSVTQSSGGSVNTL